MKVFLANIEKLPSNFILENLPLLSKDEKEKFERITNKNRRLQFLVGRIIARKSLSKILKIPANKIKIIVSKNGALLIKNEKDIFISITHSNFLVGVAISNFPVGIDIEFQKEKKNIISLFNKIYKNEDRENKISEFKLLNEEKKRQEFYDYWTKKEAIFKYQSLIEALNLNNNKQKTSQQFKVKNFSKIENFSCTICASSFKGSVRFQDFKTE